MRSWRLLGVIVLLGLVGCNGGARPVESAAKTTPVPVPVDPTAAFSNVVTVPVYLDELAEGWRLNQSWGGQYEVAALDGAHEGQRAISVTPGGDGGGLFFSVDPDSAVYANSHFLGIRFWINSGAVPLDPAQLFVALIGDTAPDTATLKTATPLSSETSLAALGISRGAAQVWVRVECWFSQLPDSRVPEKLRGFYIRYAPGYQASLQIDEVSLIALRDNSGPTVVKVTNPALNMIMLQFDETLSPQRAMDRTAYAIQEPGAGDSASSLLPDTVEYDAVRREVMLRLGTELKPGRTYAISIRGVTDTALPPNPLAIEDVTFTAAAMTIVVDVQQAVHPISPYIYGVSGVDPEYFEELRPTLISWGGNASSRYNWKLGKAWSAARDWEYRNGDYGYKGDSAADDFVQRNRDWGVATRLVVPTLGWVARDTSSCSFPNPDGSCGSAGGATCDHPGPIADPEQSSVAASPEFIAEWVQHLLTDLKGDLTFIAMDNEPELWGVTHYDVHPKCTTYDEILSRFIEYGEAVKAVAPNSKLVGPVTCCWWFYWNSMGGEVDKLTHGGQDYLPWFLSQMADYESRTGQRLLDALDIHYYPEGFYSDDASDEVAPGRLRATRTLWDPEFRDGSWIREPIQLIPRMKGLIETYYPGTELGISEWNFGADKTMNGALAIAEVLGIFGREDLDYAAYWQCPEPGSPGYNAFKMYTNFDSRGGKFGDLSVSTVSGDPAVVGTYAAVDQRTGNLHLMLIHKDAENPITLMVQLQGFVPAAEAWQYRLSEAQSQQIEASTLPVDQNFSLTLPPYSITLLVLAAK